MRIEEIIWLDAIIEKLAVKHHVQYLVSIDRYLMNKLLEVAKDRQVSVEILLDSWLK